MVRLLHYYFIEWLDMLDIGELTISAIYFLLAVWNFELSTWVYDNITSEAFKKNEELLHSFFKRLTKLLENSVYRWLEGIKDIFLAILCSFVPKLPVFIKTPLEMFGIVSYLERSMDKYKY